MSLSYLTTSAIISIGFIDIGNFVSAITAGSQYHYNLLFVLIFISIIAIFVQDTSIRLGLHSQENLATICRKNIKNTYILNTLWIIAEIALISTDFAEIIGSTIALNILFPKLSLLACLFIATINIIVILTLTVNFESILQVFVTILFVLTAFLLFILVGSVPNDWKSIVLGSLPTTNYFQNSDSIFVIMAIVGSVIMVHNLFLHSSLVTKDLKNQRYKTFAWNNCFSLLFAFLVNASIVIVASSISTNHLETLPLDLYSLSNALEKYIGYYSRVIFATSLFLSGQSSTITLTLTSIILLKGFKNFTMNTFLRRFIGRIFVFIPALIFVSILPNYTNLFLIWSQVILSFCLPFTVIPLFYFAHSEKIMGHHKINNISYYFGMFFGISIGILNFILLLHLFNLI
jgi:manganese transport protein